MQPARRPSPSSNDAGSLLSSKTHGGAFSPDEASSPSWARCHSTPLDFPTRQGEVGWVCGRP